jgi:hypothetical protein
MQPMPIDIAAASTTLSIYVLVDAHVSVEFPLQGA